MKTAEESGLYRIDAEALRIEWLADLPSRGDTAFPAVIKEGSGRFIVYNYSSPLDGWDRPWIFGQLGRTIIYACELTLALEGNV